MTNTNLENAIKNTDWSKFDGPKEYIAELVPLELISLMTLDDPKNSQEIGDRLMNTLGNNHAGTYYPVVLQALDFIIAIANEAENDACRVCALAILNDIYYFKPDIQGFDKCSREDLEKFVLDKLSPYSDENLCF